MTRLSKRGQQLLDQPTLAPYVSEHFERAASRFDPTHNPEGYIALCIAENKLDAARLAQILNGYEVGPEVLGYDDMIGNWEFREALADFMARSFLGRRFPIEQVAVVGGAGTVLELVYHSLCDAGDGVLVPTPSYSGFWTDLETRDALRVVPVHLEAEDGFELTTAALDAALDAADVPVKSLLFTNPNNPLARVYPREKVLEVVAWARAKGLHLVVDEIYALSVFSGAPFESVASQLDGLGDDVHIVWAFSKDFGASGLRCGVLVSENEGLIRSVNALGYWGAVSGHTQSLLRQFISDSSVVDDYVTGMRAGLAEAHARVEAGLDSLGLTCQPARAAFFTLCDFRSKLDAPTWEAEHALWRRIVDEANVNITPGSACRVKEPGFFRLCYAAEPPEALDEAFRRLQRVLA